MPVFSTPGPRGRYFPGCLLLVLLVLLVAVGCRSTQSAYQFRPPARAVAPPAVSADSGGAVGVARVAAPAVAPEPTAARQRVRPLRPSRVVRQQLRRAVAQVAARPPALAGVRKSAAQSTRRTAGPRHVAEVGLGTTVLGVLGLVVLPISLLGLLIWGGPIWAVLAGLAALAVLVAYLDPFR